MINWQWLAGFLDAKGYFALYKDGTSFIPEVSMTFKTDTATLLFKDIFGNENTGYDERNKTFYVRVQKGKTLMQLLSGIIPHMKTVKRKKAELLLEYLHLRQDSKYHGYHHPRERIIYLEMRNLPTKL